MTALFSYAKPPTRVTVELLITSEGTPSTGPKTRTLVIPKQGSVLIGRASTSPIKDRRPTAENALFTCPVMSRSHATISAPYGLDGPIYLDDTNSMHGVYVNGKKTTHAEINEKDMIAFGNKVTRAEATHDGVSLTVGKIIREGAIFSNPIDLTQPTKNTSPIPCCRSVPQTTYRAPDYDTDSSKENNANTTFGKPTPVPFIDLEPVSSPAPSDELDYSEDEDTRGLYYTGFESESELGSDQEGNDYGENSDDFDDDEQSYSGSERSGSPFSARDYEEDHTQREEAGSVVDEPLESPEDLQTATVHISDAELVQPKAMYPQDEEKEKTRDLAQRMSLSYFLDPTNPWDIPTMPLAPNSPSCATKDVEGLPIESKNSNLEVGVTDQDEEKDMEGQVPSLDDRQIDRELEDLGLKDQIAASQSGADEIVVQSSSPAGSKRKREIEDDGHEDIPAPATERTLLRLKFDKQRALRDFFKSRPQTGPRPSKRARHSTARFALGAAAGAIGGVATVVGVLMTPYCEELLSGWPIA